MPSTVRYYQQRARLGYTASTAETWRERWRFGVAWGSDFKLVSTSSSVKAKSTLYIDKKTKSLPLSGSPTNDVLQYLTTNKDFVSWPKSITYLFSRWCVAESPEQDKWNITIFWPYKQLLKHKTIHFTHMNEISKSSLQTFQVNSTNTLEHSPKAVKKQVEQRFYFLVD